MIKICATWTYGKKDRQLVGWMGGEGSKYIKPSCEYNRALIAIVNIANQGWYSKSILTQILLVPNIVCGGSVSFFVLLCIFVSFLVSQSF